MWGDGEGEGPDLDDGPAPVGVERAPLHAGGHMGGHLQAEDTWVGTCRLRSLGWAPPGWGPMGGHLFLHLFVT